MLMLTRLTKPLFLLALVLLTGLGVPGPAAAVIRTVTDCGDTVPGGTTGQLRNLMLISSDGDTVVIPPACATITLTGAADEDLGMTGDLDVVHSITIQGAGALRTTINGGAVDRVFEIPAGMTVTISGLTIQGGDSSKNTTPLAKVGGGIVIDGTLTLNDVEVRGNTGIQGGGIYVRTGGSLTMNRVTLAQNTSTTLAAGDGAGLYIQTGGTVTGTNVTVSGNTAATDGGGILINGGTLTLTNSTISGNTAAATFTGGGFRNLAGTVTLKNTIVANNTATTGNPDCDNVTGLTSSGHNLIRDTSGCTFTPGTGDLPAGTNPLLGSLAQNGGGKRTHTLQAGSPAINAGDNTGCPATDERGEPRPAIGSPAGTSTCDIGAFEALNVAVTLGLTLNGTTFGAGQTVQASVSYSNSGDTLVGHVLFGLLLPASATLAGCPSGQGIAFLTSLSPLAAQVTCTNKSLATFQELIKNLTLPPSGPITVPSVFSLPVTSAIPIGTYTLFIAAELPEGLADGSLDPGDLIATGAASFTITP
jgi:hypothetical protein